MPVCIAMVSDTPLDVVNAAMAHTMKQVPLARDYKLTIGEWKSFGGKMEPAVILGCKPSDYHRSQEHVRHCYSDFIAGYTFLAKQVAEKEEKERKAKELKEAIKIAKKGKYVLYHREHKESDEPEKVPRYRWEFDYHNWAIYERACFKRNGRLKDGAVAWQDDMFLHNAKERRDALNEDARILVGLKGE